MAIATLTATPDTPHHPFPTPESPHHSLAAADPPGVPPDPEARLRAAAVAGDRAAFATLYATYRDNVFRYLLRRCRGDKHLAEDLTQDTFARALCSLAGYRETGRPFGAWLVTIAGNLLTDHWRSGWHRYHLLWNDFTGESEGRLTAKEDCSGDPAIDVEASDQRQHLTRILGRAVARLSDRQQQVVSLRYAEGMSVADTALALGLEASAVKAATYRARQALACDPTVEELR